MGLLYSIAVILRVAKVVLNLAKQHLIALSKYGLTAEDLIHFEADIETGEKTKTEAESQLELKTATQDKNSTLTECVEWGDDLLARYSRIHDKKSGEYLFPTKLFNAARNSEDGMKGIMPALIKLARGEKIELEKKGQPADFPEQGETLLETLSDKDSIQENTKKTKSGTTQERLAIFEKLYDTVNDIMDMGRRAYKKDPVKKALFKSPWPGRGKGSNNNSNPQIPPEE